METVSESTGRSIGERAAFDRKPFRTAILAVAGLALAVRIGYLLFGPTIDAGDSVLYHSVAGNLVNGQGYSLNGEPFGAREPGYILFMAGIFSITGVSTSAVYVAQAFLGAIACGAVVVLGTWVGGLVAGIIGGLLLAMTPSLIAYTKVELTEVLASALIACGLLALVWLVRRPGIVPAILVGITLGLAALTRANFLSLALTVPLLITFAGVRFRTALRFGGLATLIALAVYAPWVVRNAIVFDAPVLTRIGIGDIVWSGSYVPWDGLWRGYEPPLTELREGLSPIEADRKLFSETMSNVKDDPLGVALVWAKKPIRLWAITGTTYYPENLFQSTAQRLVLVGQHLVWLAAVALAIAASIWYRQSGTVRLLVAVLAVSTLALLPGNPEWRYLLPLSPAVFVLAGMGVRPVLEKVAAVRAQAETGATWS